MTVNVALLDDYQGVAERFGDWATLAPAVAPRSLREHLELDDLVAQIRDCEVVVAMRERTALGADTLDRLPQLRLVVTTGMSNAAIDMAAAAERGITVVGTGGYLAPTTEITWGLILALARHIPAEDASVRAGGWQHTVGTELAGKTLGILGLGNLGTLVAGVGHAFGMRTVAWSQNLTSERAQAAAVELVSEDDLFAQADVLTIHLVLSERTRGIVGREQLQAMKPTALLINTSRGPIVDEDALVHALRSNEIAGAGLDVFDAEPLPPDHPLRSAPNTVLTPHIGYVTDGLYEQFYREIVEDIAAWVQGEPIRVITPPDAPT